ncbi:MAG: S-layer homology domain-containing protein [Cyanobacteria bacterium P01_A01_bin.84]
MSDRSFESMIDYILLGLLGALGIVGFVVNSQEVVAQETTFPDVSADYWARPFIQSLASKNIIEGYPDGKFRPEKAIERDEFAAIVRQAFDKEQIKKIPSGSYFQDVPQGYWGASPIEEAYESGFMKAFPQKYFRPQKELSKAEALVALTNGLNLSYKIPRNTVQKNTIQAAKEVKKPRNKTKNRLLFPLASTAMMQPFYQIVSTSTAKAASTSIENSTTKNASTSKNTLVGSTAKELLNSYYKDADKVPASAVDNIAAATQANIVVNHPQVNLLQPNENISRSEAAALVYQALVYQGRISPIGSQQQASNHVVKYTVPQRFQ